MTFGNHKREESSRAFMPHRCNRGHHRACLLDLPADWLAAEIAVDSPISILRMPPPAVGKPARPMSSVSAVIQSVAAKILIIGINALTGIITARALRPEGRGELGRDDPLASVSRHALSLGVPSALTFQLGAIRKSNRS